MPTYSGLAGSLPAENRALGAVLESVGVRSGQPDPYPDLRYNPLTGQLEAHEPGFIGSLITSTIPQTQIASLILGRDKQFTDALRLDPLAASRQVASSLGLPTPLKFVNPRQETARHELTLASAQAQAQADALRSGRDSYASSFPALAPVLESLRARQRAGQLGAYIPTAPAVDAVLPSIGTVAPSLGTLAPERRGEARQAILSQPASNLARQQLLQGNA